MIIRLLYTLEDVKNVNNSCYIQSATTWIIETLNADYEDIDILYII